jgi:lysophospholipase L1-like esterase
MSIDKRFPSHGTATYYRLRNERLTVFSKITPIFVLGICTAAAAQTFVCGAAKQGSISLTAASVFTSNAAGFDLKTMPAAFRGGACSSDSPFFVSFPASDGNYKVTVTLGGDKASITTLRAESRRLLLMEEKVAAGQSKAFTFVLHVRTADIAGKDMQVKLKPREIGALDWDNKLTLEFNGESPAVRSISIAPVSNIPTIYLAGDSTVVDQDKEPWAAWGQMLPYFFTDRIAIANEAESGETIKSFIGERRLDKVMSTIKLGDTLMIQFAHNDQKKGAGYVPAETDYKDYLRQYIALAREKGATAILVTSMNRRTFDPAGHITNSLGDYPQAMREVAEEQHVALIDLNAMSKSLYEAMGVDGTLKAFVHYPANTFPGQPDELKDDTHFNAYGAYELARCVVDSIARQKLPLAAFLRKGITPFNPSQPDSLAAWHLPPSPAISVDAPYGR